VAGPAWSIVRSSAVIIHHLHVSHRSIRSVMVSSQQLGRQRKGGGDQKPE